jgi:hypothetical protein
MTAPAVDERMQVRRLFLSLRETRASPVQFKAWKAPLRTVQFKAWKAPLSSSKLKKRVFGVPVVLYLELNRFSSSPNPDLPFGCWRFLTVLVGPQNVFNRSFLQINRFEGGRPHAPTVTVFIPERAFTIIIARLWMNGGCFVAVGHMILYRRVSWREGVMMFHRGNSSVSIRYISGHFTACIIYRKNV